MVRVVVRVLGGACLNQSGRVLATKVPLSPHPVFTHPPQLGCTEMPVGLEVCAASFESALAAHNAGVSRIELCSSLEVGGLTPSFGLTKQVVERVGTPVHVLIRPRSGGFVYSEDELSIMVFDITQAGNLGCAGVVLGVLTGDGQINLPVLSRLMRTANHYNLSVTFHRAFDDLADMQEGLEGVIASGCHRVLTSGGQSSTEEPAARENLRALIKQAGERIVIMPGAGITPRNVASLVTETGAREVHASCKRTVTASEQENSIFRADRWETDQDIVREMRNALSGLS